MEIRHFSMHLWFGKHWFRQFICSHSTEEVLSIFLHLFVGVFFGFERLAYVHTRTTVIHDVWHVQFLCLLNSFSFSMFGR